ncbi:MAG: hypothetical protein GX951_05790 [Mollicutes bacterium]|nr:hypothetical protein [Mollicutes bacterium]
MYIDLIILIVLILIVAWFFRSFSSFVYIIAITDIFLRILTFLKNNIGNNKLAFFINKYFPESIFDIINSYSESTLNASLKWAFVIIMIIFLIYTIRYFLTKRR